MKSTFGRTLTTMTVFLLIALLLIGISFQMLVKEYLTDSALEGLKQDAQVLVELLEASGSGAEVSGRDFGIALRVSSAVSGADAVICDAEGKLLLCAQSPLGCVHQGMTVSKSYLQQVYREGSCSSTGIIEGLYSDMRFVVALPVMNRSDNTPLGIVIVSSPMENTLAVLHKIREIFVFVSLLVIAICVILMVVYVRQFSNPLREMARAARAFGHGELTARVSTSGRRSQEVEELALAFNNMASSLQKSEDQRQEFVANVSHELKTPMTTISGYVDGILDGTIPEEKQEHYLQIVSQETKRLNRLVRSMLDISRLQDQGGIPEEQKSRFDVLECTGQVLITFEQKITQKNLQVQVDFPDHPVYTYASQDHITQVIYNLVDNAVKFAPEESELSVSVRQGGGKVYVSVSNLGQTIPAEELPLVFDRFHKTDKSRSQNRDSWGLGLYIVKTIVCSHGENISVTSREGKTTFTFTLPLTN